MKVVQLVLLGAVFYATMLPLSAQHSGGQMEVGVYGSAVKLMGGDADYGMVSPLLGMKLGYTVSQYFTVTLNGGYGWTYPMDTDRGGLMRYLTKYPDTPFKTILIPVMADVRLNCKPERQFNPYLTWGLGILMWDLKSDGISVHDQVFNGLIDWGFGFELFITRALGFDAGFHYLHLMNQQKDMSGYGDVQSGIMEARAGINLYFGGKSDRDTDGILDKNDRCPDQPEDMDGFQDEDGCPDLDNDGDGIFDLNDQASDQAEDVDGYEDGDGIPDPDNDGDGIQDAGDKAPLEKEDFDGYMDDDGAPDFDNDGDGIPDSADQCPNIPETVNAYLDEDGCPDEKSEIIIKKEAPIVLEGITFEIGSSALTAEAKAILDKVHLTLVDYPDMVLEVSGHTDNSGNRQSNIRLSRQRAESVKQYLLDQGIAPDRIITKGYGPDQPIVSNDTSEGRAKNRRIEFLRIK